MNGHQLSQKNFGGYDERRLNELDRSMKWFNKNNHDVFKKYVTPQDNFEVMNMLLKILYWCPKTSHFLPAYISKIPCIINQWRN